MGPRFFPTRKELRAWFTRNAAKEPELIIGFYKVASGKPSITNQEAVEEALCFGWIDGVVKGIDAESYQKRFSPRKAKSYWSAVNIRYAERLIAEEMMTAAGLATFEKRDGDAEKKYSFENAPRELSSDVKAALRARPGAWEWWERAPPSYQRAAAFWMESPKQEATRARRLGTLVDRCAEGLRVPPLRPWPGPAAKKPVKKVSAKKPR